MTPIYFTSELNRILTSDYHTFYYTQSKADLAFLANKIARDNAVPDINQPSPAIKKFRNLVRKLQHAIAVGSLVKDAIPLDKDYWLEALGMKLVIDGETFEGHLYPAYFVTEEKYLEKWKTAQDERGVPYQERLCFEDYMNKVIIPQLSPQEKETLKAKLSVVEYYSPSELADFEAHFDKEGMIYTASASLNEWIDFKAKNPQSKLSYRQFHAESPALSEKKSEKHPILEDQTYIYILDSQGRLYLQIKNRGKTNHTSLSNGHAVLAAGNVKVKDGKIIEVDTFSGHYKPTEVQLITFLTFLKKAHVDLDKVKMTYVAEYDIQPWKILTINQGEVTKWLEERLKASA